MPVFTLYVTSMIEGVLVDSERALSVVSLGRLVDLSRHAQIGRCGPVGPRLVLSRLGSTQLSSQPPARLSTCSSKLGRAESS
jgi:hypothetical protein